MRESRCLVQMRLNKFAMLLAIERKKSYPYKDGRMGSEPGNVMSEKWVNVEPDGSPVRTWVKESCNYEV